MFFTACLHIMVVAWSDANGDPVVTLNRNTTDRSNVCIFVATLIGSLTIFLWRLLFVRLNRKVLQHHEHQVSVEHDRMLLMMSFMIRDLN